MSTNRAFSPPLTADEDDARYICASVFGLYGCAFVDLGDAYQYIE